MIPIPISAGWRGLPHRFKTFLLAAALPVSMAVGANQTAMAMPEAGCAAGSATNTDAASEVCLQDAAGTQDDARLQSLEVLSAHGLDPAVYTGGGASAREAWLLAATHLRRGVLEPETLTPRQEADTALAATASALAPDADASAYRAALEALAPASPLYAALKAELELQQDALDAADAEASAAAQGRIGALRASLERLRWLPPENSPRQIYANIPTFEVIAFSGETEVSRHKAIFGELDRETPAFSDSIGYLEFSPWWNLPASMSRKDKLPQFRSDPGDIERLGYQVFDAAGDRVDTESIDWDAVPAAGFPYRIRQAPGPENALGQVKFMFPNQHAIYLHDTPDTDLFSQEQRTFSAGCVRVEDAVALSEWVLEDTPGWDRAKIDSAIASGTATRAKLAAPMSIHIVYLTAFPAADGSISYAPDVYGLDAAILPALASYSADFAAGAAPAEGLGAEE